MLKVRFFMNEPRGKPWRHFEEMTPRLGAQYEIEVEMTSKPRAEYQTDEYFELDLPTAPAVMVGDEIVVEGADVGEFELETVICRCLGLPTPEAPKKKGLVSRLMGRDK